MSNNLKLLFWTDSFLLHYCLAHTIQQKTNHEIYGIFDVPNRLKSFFNKQKFVNYKKIWFFHDNISKTNTPDLNYLRKYEEKYDLNLWKLAINERVFRNYNPFYRFNRNEILSILESEFKLFEEILDTVHPDYLITLDPGLHHSHLLYQICKKKSIPILLLNISKFSNMCYISQSIHRLDQEPDPNDDQNFSFEDLQKLLTSNNLSQPLERIHSKTIHSKTSRIKAGLDVFSHPNSNIDSHYTYYGRTKQKILLTELSSSLKTKKRKKFLDNNSTKIIDNEKFIYLPLNQEPERSLLIDAPFFTNQIETVNHISKSIPIDYVLYVKEHPTQGAARGWRPISDYKKILDLPNTKLIHPDVPSLELIKKSSLVVTIGGSSSFEAQIFNRPSIMFADLGYQEMGSIKKIDSLDVLPSTINSLLNSKVDLKKLSIYVSSLFKHSFNFDFFGFQIRSGNKFFYNENLVDIEINEDDMKDFLKTEKINLDILADEHIKKIQFYEKNPQKHK